METTLHLPAPLGNLPPEDQTTLAAFLEPVRFQAGDVILEEGEPGDSCYVIEQGKVRIEVRRSHVDTENVLEVLEPGAFLGELSLLDRLPRSASAVAETDVVAHRFTTEALDDLLRQHPAVGTALLRELGRDAAQKLRHTTARLATLVIPEEPDAEVEAMVRRATEAQEQFAAWPEDRVDAMLQRLAEAVAAEAQPLAEETVAETQLGNVQDKTIKNTLASVGVFRAVAGKTGAGALQEHVERGVTEIASPVGVVFGIIPVTNPVATAVFKTIICLKARNALILSFHRGALGVGHRVGEIVQGVLREAGAPTDLVQWIQERSSRKMTARYMSHPDVGLILATGGSGMVRAAYSSGTPALGVGPGNAPAWIRPDADLQAAAYSVVLSKTFDYGLICGAENNLVVDAAVREPFIEALTAQGAAVLSAEEARRFSKVVVDPETRHFRPQIVGQSAARIAGAAGIERDYEIRLVVVPADDPSSENPYAGEKMAPLLSLFTVDGVEEGLALCKRLLAQEGTGHTAVIHTADEDLARRFGAEMPASRILVNSPGTQGVVGLTTGLEPSLTLGCGTFGGNSTSDNVTYRHLFNVKRLARFVEAEHAGAQLG